MKTVSAPKEAINRIVISNTERNNEDDFIRFHLTKFITDNLDLLNDIKDIDLGTLDSNVEVLLDNLDRNQVDRNTLRRLYIISKDISKNVGNYPSYLIIRHPEYPGLVEDLGIKISGLIEFIQDYHYNKNINIDYFVFLDLNNPLVRHFFNPVKLTPQTFKLFAVNSDKENQNILDTLQSRFYQGTIFKNFKSIHGFYGSVEWQGEQFRQGIPDNQWDYTKDPGYRRYVGWTKKQLLTALEETGLFDYESEKYGGLYAYKFPKLKELGIPNPVPIFNDTPDKYIKGLHRYALEALYSKVMDTTLDWNQVCKSGADLEYLRQFAKKELGILISGNQEEFCTRLLSIVRNLELREELPNIQQEFIMYPGTKEHPRIMYTKYMPTIQQSSDNPRGINIERYLVDIKNICENPNKSSYDAYQFVVDIGLQNYVNRTDSKQHICEVVDNYLNVIRNERIY